MNHALSSYRDLEIGSSRPEVLVLRLYEAALRHCRAAREHIEAGRVRDRSLALSKTLAIIGELQQVLDFERGGSIARELDRLYTFASGRLMDAAIADDVKAIDDVVRVLEPLWDGWLGIVEGRGEDAA